MKNLNNQRGLVGLIILVLLVVGMVGFAVYKGITARQAAQQEQSK